jgi:endonuclease III
MKKQKDFIVVVNKLLAEHFGIPKRNRKLPNPLDMLIATILSQNTNDNNSYKAFQNLKANYKSWEELLDERQSTIEKVIRVAGLAKQKASAIKNLLNGLRKEFRKVSIEYVKGLSDEEAIASLTKYNGVGVKTASCVLLFALDRNLCPVDTHVHRTTNRLGIVAEKTPDKTFSALNKNFPAGIAHSFHTNLIRLGREICKPTNPACSICPLFKVCLYKNKNLESASSSKPKAFMLLDNVE